MNPNILQFVFAIFFMIVMIVIIGWPVSLKETIDNRFLVVLLIIVNLIILRIISFIIKKRVGVSSTIDLIDISSYKLFSKFYNYTNKPFTFSSSNYSIEGFNGEDNYKINRLGKVNISFSGDSISFIGSYHTKINLNWKIISSHFESSSKIPAKNTFITEDNTHIFFLPHEKIYFTDKDRKVHTFSKLHREHE